MWHMKHKGLVTLMNLYEGGIIQIKEEWDSTFFVWSLPVAKENLKKYFPLGGIL